MKPNILYISLPTLSLELMQQYFSGEQEYYVPVSMPLGIMYVASYAGRHNELGQAALIDFVVKMRNIKGCQDIRDFIERMLTGDVSFTPDIVAISLSFSSSHQFFTILMEVVKRLWPEAVIITGGPHATNCTGYLLENTGVHYVARGECEISFSKFVMQLSNGEAVRVKGIYALDNLGDKLEISDRAEDLDRLPYPAYELLDMEQYVTEKGRKKHFGRAREKRLACIVTTRGCPFRCTFCSSHTVHGRKMRFRSIENILGELQYLYDRYGVSLFIPEDDLFTVRKARIIRLLNEMKKLDIPDLEMQFTNALSVNTLDPDVIDALIGVGMKVAYLAIESGSQYVQDHIIKKHVNLEKARGIVRYMREKDIIVRCYIILGFPRETREQMLETVEYVKSLQVDWASFIVATPLIGSEMYDEFIELGYIKDGVDMWSGTHFSYRMFDTDEISAGDLMELKYRANLEVNFIGNPNLVGGNYGRAIELYNDILDVYPFHIIGWYCLAECYRAREEQARVEEIEAKIRNLVETDSRSKKMYDSYRDMMPHFNL